MADDIDRAQDREQLDRALALQALGARIKASFEPRDPSVADTCIDCGSPIEPARLIALRGATSLCAACARAFEHEHTQPRRGA